MATTGKQKEVTPKYTIDEFMKMVECVVDNNTYGKILDEMDKTLYELQESGEDESYSDEFPHLWNFLMEVVGEEMLE